MGDHGEAHLEIKSCNWNLLKTLDLYHLYICLGLLIYGPIVLYANIFIGPATLAEIPEGYKPKHWEYYKVYIDMYSYLCLISQCNACLLHIYVPISILASNIEIYTKILLFGSSDVI